jgi:hypothetical protein
MSSISKLMMAMLLVLAVSTGTLFATGQQSPGTIFITDKKGDVQNTRFIFANPGDVYLTGGPESKRAPGLTDGTYYFQVTNPSGTKLLSTDDAKCRQVVVSGGKITGVPSSESCSHAVGLLTPGNPSIPVQLAPFSASPDDDDEYGEYKVWLIRKVNTTSVSTSDPKVVKFSQSNAKTDTFRVKKVQVPQGSCQPSESMSVLVVGKQVFSVVPKGSWTVPNKDVGVVMLEPHATPVIKLSTPQPVNSCASNPRTLQTVCTTNEKDVYVFTGPFITSTRQSGASLVWQSSFFGGSCSTCNVTMDAIHNEALLGISLTPEPPTFAGSGFQYLNLGLKPKLEPPFPSMAPMPFNPGGEISKGILIDPNRDWILSANESGNYEIIKVSRESKKHDDHKKGWGRDHDDDADHDRGRGNDDDDDHHGRGNDDDDDDHDHGHGNDDDRDDEERRLAYFENTVVHPVTEFVSFSSAAEDCTTGIALAPLEASNPSEVYLADLTRAQFTSGTPGTWTAPSRFQTLEGSSLGFSGPNGIAVAQGTQTGALIGMSNDTITAIKLPTAAGGGPAPKIEDWVSCRLPGLTGNAPHTVNAYQSPSTGHAMAVVGDLPASKVWLVDLTDMLKLKRLGAHTCESVFLPAKVVDTIAVP